MFSLAEETKSKWKPIIEHEDLAPIADPYKKMVTTRILENTQKALRENAAQNVNFLGESGAPTNSMGFSSSTAGTGGIDTFDPVLISLVRRAMPNLIAYDICGVQPMTGPTGLIFALRARYEAQDGPETFYNEVNTGFSARGGMNANATSAGYASDTVMGGAEGNPTTFPGTPGTFPTTANNAGSDTYNFAGGVVRALAEGAGSGINNLFPEMAFSIEKVSVEAKARNLKAEYSIELAQDLKAVHGLDAETELSNILSSEILAEINREVVRTIIISAVRGASEGVTTNGIFDLDTDSNGRWSVEKWKGLMFQIEREANAIAKATRRGKGNILICSSDVASALQMAGILDYAPALNSNNLQVDDTGNTFAGVLNGRMRVYIDPYAGNNFMVVGYKGSDAYDAGLFYCPYVPLQMVRAVDPNTFQPKIGFKTRYGMVANPFAEGGNIPPAGFGGRIIQDSNVYYRRVIVNNIM